MLTDRFKDIADEYEKSLRNEAAIKVAMPRAGETNDTELTMFQIVRAEIFKFFCGSSDEDNAARRELGDDVAKISSYICGAAAVSLAATGVAIPIITLTAAVSLLLTITVKIGHRSLCRYAERFSLDEDLEN